MHRHLASEKLSRIIAQRIVLLRNHGGFLADDGLAWPYAVYRGHLLGVRSKNWAENDGKEASVPIEQFADRLQRVPSAF